MSREYATCYSFTYTDPIGLRLTELRMLAPVDCEVVIYECKEWLSSYFLSRTRADCWLVFQSLIM